MSRHRATPNTPSWHRPQVEVTHRRFWVMIAAVFVAGSIGLVGVSVAPADAVALTSCGGQ